MRELSGGDLIVRAASKLWRRESCWKDIAKLRFTAFRLRNARSSAEQTLKVQTGVEQNGLPWRYRKVNYCNQLERDGELLKRGFPGATTQIGKKIPVIEEVSAQDFQDAEDDVSVFPCNFFQSPSSKF